MKKIKRQRITPHKRHAVSGGPAGQTGISYANGDIWCNARERRIEPVICTIQSFREPMRCTGCPYAGGETAQKNHNKKEVRV